MAIVHKVGDYENESESNYQVLSDREETAVQQMLRRYPFLVPLLLDTRNRIEEHFPSSQVFLNVATDAEPANSASGRIDNTQELVISIATRLSAKEAIEVLEKFYDDWWLKASKEAKGKISIGLECL